MRPITQRHCVPDYLIEVEIQEVLESRILCRGVRELYGASPIVKNPNEAHGKIRLCVGY